MNATIIPNLVSTIIPVYNRPKMVVRAVESVLAQRYRPIEIILVNDGSTDDTASVLNQLAERYPKEIRVIHQENKGPGLAREAGRQLAQGEFIQYLDSDDWLLPNKFEDQVNALREHPDCDIAYGISRVVDQNGTVLHIPGKLTDRKIAYLFPTLLVYRWWETASPLFSRSIVDRVGPWEGRYRLEDWEMEARMGQYKPKLIHCGTLVSYRSFHSGNHVSLEGSVHDRILDEYWLLPRLYRYAMRAGVSRSSPEMQHFSRWVFMRSRHLGQLGESEKAWELLQLYEKTSLRKTTDYYLVKLAAKTIGWRATGQLCRLVERYKSGNSLDKK